MSMKNCNDTIGNRTRDLLACSAVPQSNVHLHAPIQLCIIIILQYLKDANLVNENTVTKPNKVEREDLLLVHTARYLKSLKVSLTYCF
jgi:acetoin utilization deacetylase AcuC-like enzyme